MKDGFQQLLIGSIFIFFNIYLVVDILPNFLGYILIFNGIKQLATNTSIPFHRLKIFCMLMALISVPHFFSFDNIVDAIWLSYYIYLMDVLKLIFMYMLFRFLLQATSKSGEVYPQTATAKIQRWYMIVIIITNFFKPFVINMVIDIQVKTGLVLLISNLIIEFFFLIYLLKMKNFFSRRGPHLKIKRAMELAR